MGRDRRGFKKGVGGKRTKMSEEKKDLGNWEHKSNEEKAKEVEAVFGEELEYVEEGEKKVEEDKKEETQEEKKERYIDILVGIGFLKGKDKGDGKERFYYKVDNNLTVGRTFDSRTPLGKFWCRENGKFLKEGECKEIPIIQEFYEIRDGKREMPRKKEEIKKKIAVRTEEIAEVKPNQVIMDAQQKADSLYAVVEKQHLYMQIHDKKYLTVEAWEILGKFCNLSATIEWVRPVEIWDARGFEARVVVTDSRGKVVSAAESMCMNDEGNWKGKPIFQLKSMAQTRAMSKAYRMCLSFIVSLAGYSPTPYEEMET